MSLTETRAGSVSRAPRPSSLADVLDLILDKGLVIDAYVRVSLAGIELLTIDARVVVASVDTYLRFAEAVNRLDLTETESPGLRGLSRDLSDKQEGGSENGKDSNALQEGDSTDGRNDGPKRRQQRTTTSSGQDPAEDDTSGSEADGKEEAGGGMLHRLAERARFEQ